MVLLYFTFPVAASEKWAQDEGEIEPKEFVEVEGYLFPGMYDEYGWPEKWTPFYLREGQEVGITIMWSPLALMKIGIVTPEMDEDEWAASSPPVWGSEVRVSAPADGLYYVRIKKRGCNTGNALFWMVHKISIVSEDMLLPAYMADAQMRIWNMKRGGDHCHLTRPLNLFKDETPYEP